MKPRSILLISAGFLAVLLPAVVLINRDNPGSSPPMHEKHGFISSQPGGETGNSIASQQSFPADLDPALLAALRQADPARRRELLGKWAAVVGTSAMEKTLAELDAIEKSELRSEVRGILLSTWAGRDASGMAGWFVKRLAADAVHQQARDILAREFVHRDPPGMLSWMQQSLPESVRSELYGPFFRQWAASDPAAAGATLRQLSVTSGEDPARTAQWNDMIAQVAAVWAGTDLGRAVGWVQSLPEGAAKSKALVQISYRWAENDPQQAAICAASRSDPAMLKAVFGRWAESDPVAAASYAGGLPEIESRSQAVISAVSTWAAVAPEQAALWASQLPENPVRGQALEQVMGAWSEQDARAAGQWLQTLPESIKRQLLANALQPGQK